MGTNLKKQQPPPMDKSPIVLKPVEPLIPESKLFPILIQGTVDGVNVCCPFLTAHDITNYLEGLEWGMRKLNAKIDVTIYQAGVKVGEMKTPVECTVLH
jgi:hypothetical protein